MLALAFLGGGRYGCRGRGRRGGGRRQTILFFMLLVLPHGHETGAGGEDFVPEATLVVGLLGIAVVVVDLLLRLLGVVYTM